MVTQKRLSKAPPYMEFFFLKQQILLTTNGCKTHKHIRKQAEKAKQQYKHSVVYRRNTTTPQKQKSHHRHHQKVSQRKTKHLKATCNEQKRSWCRIIQNSQLETKKEFNTCIPLHQYKNAATYTNGNKKTSLREGGTAPNSSNNRTTTVASTQQQLPKTCYAQNRNKPNSALIGQPTRNSNRSING